MLQMHKLLQHTDDCQIVKSPEQYQFYVNIVRTLKLGESLLEATNQEFAWSARHGALK